MKLSAKDRWLVRSMVRSHMTNYLMGHYSMRRMPRFINVNEMSDVNALTNDFEWMSSVTVDPMSVETYEVEDDR